MFKKIFIALCITSLFGCASMFGTLAKDETMSGWGAKKTYIGTKIDGAALVVIPVCAAANTRTRDCRHGPALLLVWPFVLIDLPLSFVADTVLLPYTLYHDHRLKHASEAMQMEPSETQQMEPSEAQQVEPPSAPEKETLPPPEVPHLDIPEKDNPNFKPVENDTLGLMQEKVSGDA